MNDRPYLERALEKDIAKALGRSPVVAVLGPRQCGKSTLAKQMIGCSDAVYLDLQNRSDRAKLSEPELFVEQHRGRLICLDEIQLVPEFFSFLRSEVDYDRRPGRFLILGSASRDLIRQSSESLAGRIAYLELTPFSLDEVSDHATYQKLWVRGGFPESLLAENGEDSRLWREDFIRTFLERDIPALGARIPTPIIERLWRLLAHYHGQTLNYSKLAGVVDISVPSLRKYLSLFEQNYMIRLLPPCVRNLKKRLTQSPKIFLRDSGILHALLAIDTYDDLLGHAQLGASWEGFAMEQVLGKMPGWRPSFLRTGNAAEVDLVLERGSEILFFEFKCSKAPKLRRGFTELSRDIHPDAAWLIAPVDEAFAIRQGVTAASPLHFLDSV